MRLPRVDLALQTKLPSLIFEYEMERLLAIEDRRAYMATSQAPLVELLLNEESVNIMQFWIGNFIYAEVKASVVDKIASFGGVEKIFKSIQSVAESVVIKPSYARNITQSEMFRVNGYDGGRATGELFGPSQITVGVIEGEFFETEHDAFFGDANHSNSRVWGTFNCNCYGVSQYGDYCDDWTQEPDSGCGPPNQYGECSHGHRDYCLREYPLDIDEGLHATSVLGIIAADCMEGQCWLVQPDEYKAKTGIAPKVGIATLNHADKTVLFIKAVEQAVGVSLDILNYSYGSYDHSQDNDCPTYERARGQDDESKAVNSAYLNGILTVTSAGNNREDCNYIPTGYDWVRGIGSPASAASALAVGAYNGYRDDPYNDFYGSLEVAVYSSRGRTYDYRVKPDILASTEIACLPKFYDSQRFFDCTSPFGSSPLGGTSACSPVVAGAAAVLKDYFIHRYGTGIVNDPGRLIANIINFGDRTETTSTGFFDSVNGAGRLRMRLPNSHGLDTPWSYRTYKNVFYQGTSLNLDIGPFATSNPIPGDVDIIKIVVWWYEPQVEIGGIMPRFTMTLQNTDNPSLTYTANSYQTTAPIYKDHKMQIILDSNNTEFLNFATSASYELTITNVLMWPIGSQRNLYITYFWEDGDRDDFDCAPCSDQVGPGRCQCDSDDPDYLFYKLRGSSK